LLESTPQSRPGDLAAAAAAPLAGSVAEICAGVAAGDAAAITRLYKSRFGLLYATARRITGRDEAFGLDATQETFLRVLAGGSALRRIAGEQDLDRWLIRVTHSACIDLLRSERRRMRREQARSTHASPTYPSSSVADIEHLQKLLNQLEHDDQSLLRLRMGGATLESIARSIGATTGAVHGRIRRAISRLNQADRESNDE
jgi:RNA polymerase sigma factor (sigma-70 family)